MSRRLLGVLVFVSLAAISRLAQAQVVEPAPTEAELRAEETAAADPAPAGEEGGTLRYTLSAPAPRPRLPVHFRIAPDSERLDLTLYVQVGTTTARGPGGSF